MRFSVESWDPSYGVAVDEVELERAAADVDAAVELPLDRWCPLDAQGTPSEEVAFVDGVRRVDARVWIHGDAVHAGVCATIAAGVVVAADRARVVDVQVARLLVATADGAEAIITAAGTYELAPVASDTPDALYLAIHDRMTRLELDVSRHLPDTHPGALLVFDGPLRGRSTGVGYVKTQHVQYLEPPQQRVIVELEPGQRTPLFLIGGRWSRYSWYLRLPGRRAHPLAGVVRCEVPASCSAAEAVASADRVAATLPRFSSEPHKDGRAPQNLYPIAGLERELRRRLGDPQLLERALRVASTGPQLAGLEGSGQHRAV